MIIIRLFQMKISKILIWSLLFFSLSGCQSAYYGALEKVGIHKRDVLVSRVEKAKDTQEEAKEQFKSALEKFKSVTHFDGGDLETAYNNLNDEFEESQALANDIRSHISDIEDVSDAMFEEWENELEQYTNQSLKRKSAQQLSTTKRQYAKLIKTMKRAEKTMQPVLNIFKDQVLFLKHNLNARAIASLKGEIKTIETNVSRLIKQMNSSIDEANRFINSMNQN